MTVTEAHPGGAPGAHRPEGLPARLDRRRATRPRVSVVIPTYNEAESLPILVERLRKTLSELDHELVVVDDDSPDGTWRVAQGLAGSDPRLRVIRRVGERGLSSAVMAGMQASTGRAVAVIDADLQHDESVLPAMVAAVLDGGADICIGSRLVDGGSYGEFSRSRRLLSQVGAELGRRVLGLEVSDLMSGYFVVSRERVDEVGPAVNPRGFKILLELLARGPRPRVVEVGYRFGRRQHGATKLTGSVLAAYLLALVTLALGRRVSATFAAYALVGTVGLAVGGATGAGAGLAGLTGAGVVAFEVGVAVTFVLHNRLTFAAHRRRGVAAVRSLALFHLVSLHGLLVQRGVHDLVVGSAAGGWASRAAGPAVVAALAVFWSSVAATVGTYLVDQRVTWRSGGASR